MDLHEISGSRDFKESPGSIDLQDDPGSWILQPPPDKFHRLSPESRRSFPGSRSSRTGSALFGSRDEFAGSETSTSLVELTGGQEEGDASSMALYDSNTTSDHDTASPCDTVKENM